MRILKQEERTEEECLFLADYLLYLEDFRRYMGQVGQVVKIRICQLLKVVQYQLDQVVFRKGDDSDVFYIVMKGGIDVYNEENGCIAKKVGSVTAGRQIGERGCVRNLPRSLTAIANEKTLLLSLNSVDFKALLGDDAYVQLQSKLSFIEEHFPFVKKLTHVQKERIAYVMTIQNFKRRQVIISEGEINDNIYFINYGEVSIMSPIQSIPLIPSSTLPNLNSSVKAGAKLLPNLPEKTSVDQLIQRRRPVIKLGVGSCFGEEGAILNKKVVYNYEISSEYATLYLINKLHMKDMIPEETQQYWKSTYEDKERKRTMLIRSSINKNFHQAQSQSTPILEYPYHRASPNARKRLIAQQQRNRYITPTLQNSDDSSSNINLALQRYLRHISPSKILDKPQGGLGVLYSNNQYRQFIVSKSRANKAQRMPSRKMNSSFTRLNGSFLQNCNKLKRLNGRLGFRQS